MSTETAAQRRTRLIEQYSGLIYTESARHDFEFADNRDYIAGATHNAKQLADAVIAATPQEPEPTRYPSEIETRLIELCEKMMAHICPSLKEAFGLQLCLIKRDL